MADFETLMLFAEELEDFAARLRKRAADEAAAGEVPRIDPAMNLIQRARTLYPGLGEHQQKALKVLGDHWKKKPLTTGAISNATGTGNPVNTNQVLNRLVALGFAEAVAGTYPQQWLLGPRLRPAEDVRPAPSG